MKHVHSPTLREKLGTVSRDAVSFVSASVSMRLRLSFTLRRSSSLSEPGRSENAFKSGAFSKRYGSLALTYLSDEGPLRKTANAFGLFRACVSVIIRRVTRAITVHLFIYVIDLNFMFPL